MKGEELNTGQRVVLVVVLFICLVIATGGSALLIPA